MLKDSGAVPGIAKGMDPRSIDSWEGRRVPA